MSDALDTIAPHFRRMTERWPDAPTMQNHYSAVAESWVGSRQGLVETVKSFVECVCLTILGEYGQSKSTSSPSTKDMLVEALSLLGLQNSREGGNLSRVLSAHNKLADALSDMRNVNGPVAHGKDGFLDSLTENQTRTYLLVADTLVAILLAALEGTEPDLHYTREPYERFTHLHRLIDASVLVETSVDYDSSPPVIIVNMSTRRLPDGVELHIEPSRLLYAIDRTAYIELLAASARNLAEEIADGSAEVTTEEAVEVVPPSAPTTIEPDVERPLKIIPAYSGYLLPLADDLRQYIGTLNLPSMPASPLDKELIDSLLVLAEANMGVDWQDRDTLQASIRVAFRHTLSQFGLVDEDARNGADKLLAWLRSHAGELSSGERGSTK